MQSGTVNQTEVTVPVVIYGFNARRDDQGVAYAEDVVILNWEDIKRQVQKSVQIEADENSEEVLNP